MRIQYQVVVSRDYINGIRDISTFTTDKVLKTFNMPEKAYNYVQDCVENIEVYFQKYKCNNLHFYVVVCYDGENTFS